MLLAGFRGVGYGGRSSCVISPNQSSYPKALEHVLEWRPRQICWTLGPGGVLVEWVSNVLRLISPKLAFLVEGPTDPTA